MPKKVQPVPVEVDDHSDSDVSEDDQGDDDTLQEDDDEIDNDADEIDMDSDEELQEAFAAGLIKPGLNNIGLAERKKKDFTNNVAGLKSKLEQFRLALPWIERLDLVNKPAPLAPELAYEEEMRKASDDLNVHDDFKRELLFYRQAQAAVLEALPRLKSMNVATKRPTDYFAQMAKSDEQMQKVREKLVSKQVVEERREKIRKLRDLKKYGKKVQIEVQQRRQKEKKDMLDQVKKFRKGQADTIDFLDNDDDFGGPSAAKKEKGGQNKSQDQGKAFKPGQGGKKQGIKNQKFGFGGKKRGLKHNTRESVDDVSSFRSSGRGKGAKPGSAMAKKIKGRRMGKERRKQMKGRKAGGK